ncbi:BolA family transcriptional regulator [Mariprofundus sp. NF]|uniref:BolA family protein n=1 Tax=Mariprofundus sp. NF TaxID=2608716 RepID=UPI0015A1BB40|nr:BolA family protein [Mariprofundus sp. NF]NWF37697.1 BolA family transcriptional regulator [Mariprofundus sp. NF]
MSQKAELIQRTLEAEFNPESIKIEDESWKHAGHAAAKESGGGHFTVQIKSSSFNGLSRMQSHRKVMQALKPLFPATIHAVSIRTEATTS